jgi:hypothetical protein
MLRRVLVTLSSVFILGGTLLAQSSQFIEAPQYAVGTSPLAAAIGDLNGDGKPDIVITNKVDETISVLLNNGDGTFAPQVVYNVGGVPASLAIADLNGDGNLDVVVALPVVGESQGSQIAVLYGKGDGTLRPYVLFSTGVAPQFVVAQDLNGDGKPDLVVANVGKPGDLNGTVSVLINNGSGKFPSHTEYATGVAPLALVVADFNGDHKPDLAVANSCGSDPTCNVSTLGTVSILLGNGDGTFQAQSTLSVGYDPDAIVAADFNGDGKADLAVGNFNDSTVSVLIGNGDGTFKPKVSYTVDHGQPYGIVAADLNHDGKLDLAVSTTGATTVSILLGNGDGTFQSHKDYWAGNGAGILAAADLNGDSNIDLVVPDLGWAERADSKVTVLFGNGDGTFRSHVLYNTGVAPGALALGDFNGDGKLDLVVGENPAVVETPDCGCARISVLLGNGDGTYMPSVDYATGRFPSSVAVGDFNGDGHLDIAVANYGTLVAPANTISVLLGNGDGTFQPQVTYTVGNNPTAIAVADVNHDGKLDLVFSNSGDTSPNIGVLLGNGDGTFQAQITTATSGVVNTLAIVDLNQDKIPDVVGLLSASNKVATFLGRGDGTFSAKGSWTTGNNPLSLAIGDFNGDNTPDVAIVNQADPESAMAVFYGNGDGTLRIGPSYPIANQPTSIIAGDFNGDAQLDLLVANAYFNTAQLFLGKGDGTFPVAPIAYGTGWQPLALAAGDLNGDGTLDVVSANSGVGSVSVILNSEGTVVTLQSSSATSSYGDPITLTVTVAPSIWGPTPSGSVNFYDGNNLLGAEALASGSATFTTSTLNVGTHTLSAVYLGDTNFQRHASSSVTQKVNLAGTTTTLGSSVNPSISGQPVIFAANVSPANSGTPTGSVTFLDGAVTIGTGSLASGAASLSISTLAVGTHTITASYSGDSDFSASTSPEVSQVVSGPDFSISASALSGSLTAGQSSTSTITLTSQYGFSGTVTLTCSSGLPSGASCAFAPASLVPSADGVTSTLTISTTAATPAGNFSLSIAGTSGAIVRTFSNLSLSVANFTITAPASATPSSIPAGQSSSATLTWTSGGGFTDVVNLTCSVSPTPSRAPTCSMNPASITPTGAGASSVLTINTTAPVTASLAAPAGRSSGIFYALWLPMPAIAFLGIFFDRRRPRKRNLLALLFMAFLISTVICLPGCGGGSSNTTKTTQTTPGTPSGAYTITITGTSAATTSPLAHTATVAVTVQ